MSKQLEHGLTLLEVLIALSIFSLIGVASYQVLNTTIASQKSGDFYSQQLSIQQKAMMIIDSDIQQLINRPVRISATDDSPFLVVNSDAFPLEFSRGGHRNPLMLPRSTLQRIAYDVGLHPRVADRDSSHYQDDKQYLRRHIWTALDRGGNAKPFVQALLSGIIKIDVAVLTEEGRKAQWPITTKTTKNKSVKALGLELLLTTADESQITRLYPVL